MIVNHKVNFVDHERVNAVAARVGATLIEISIVLMIIAALFVGALSIASNVMSQSSATQEMQTLTNLSSAAYQARTNQGYPDNIVASISLLGLVPDNVTKTGSGANTQIFNSWSGEIKIDGVGGATNQRPYFKINYKAIPKKECLSLVKSVKTSTLRTVGRGGVANEWIDELTATKIEDLCSENINEITWSTEPL